MWDNWRKCYPLKLEFISLTLVSLSSYIVFSNYSALPDTIPINFDALGNPDNWGDKGWVIILLIIGVVNFLFMTLINFLFSIVDDPRHLINLPKGRNAIDVLTKE